MENFTPAPTGNITSDNVDSVVHLLAGDDDNELDLDDSPEQPERFSTLQESEYRRQHGEDTAVEQDAGADEEGADDQGEVPETQAGLEADPAAPGSDAQPVEYHPQAMQSLEQVKTAEGELVTTVHELNRMFRDDEITQAQLNQAIGNANQYANQLREQNLVLREQQINNKQYESEFHIKTAELIPGWGDNKKREVLAQNMVGYYREQTGATQEQAIAAGNSMTPQQLRFIHNSMKMARRESPEVERNLYNMEQKMQRAKQRKLNPKPKAVPAEDQHSGQFRAGDTEGQISAISQLLMG